MKVYIFFKNAIFPFPFDLASADANLSNSVDNRGVANLYRPVGPGLQFYFFGHSYF